MEIKHDVGVRVKKPADMEAMKEPLCPVPDVSRLSAVTGYRANKS